MPQIGPEQQEFFWFYEKEILQDSLTDELAQEKLGRKRKAHVAVKTAEECKRVASS
jgi:hypothetical protein